MNEKFAEVGLSDLNPGDVVHVSFKSSAEQNLYLNMKIIKAAEVYVKTQEGYYFYESVSRYYLVEKAKKPLPTELGSVVKHPDGWQFIRLDEDNWKGIDRDCISPFKWTDAEVASDDWEEVA